MVTVIVNGAQAPAEDHDRSRGGVEGRRRHAAGPDRRRGQRRAPQGRRGDEAEDGRHARRPGLRVSALDVAAPASLQELVEQFKSCPASARRGAQRLAFHVLRTPREDAERLCEAIRDVKDRVTYCSICNNITDADPVRAVRDASRDQRMICVVEEPQNVNVVEKTRRVPRRLPRADGRDLAAAGRRPRRSEDQGPARRASPAAAWTK